MGVIGVFVVCIPGIGEIELLARKMEHTFVM